MRLIDADAVVLEYDGLEHISPCDFRGIAEYFTKQIMAMPTVESRPKGKWISFRTGNGLICVKCSECKTAYGFLRTPFCPNCGAKMRGDSE